jgi:asparagine synthase (glutamine-hydrolysing)
MCGVAGFVDFRGTRRAPQDRLRILQGMGRQLSRRGPDDEQLYDDDFFSLVFRRLSIVDIEHGRQPIWNEDDTVMVAVNGEIYNHADLRRGLSDRHRFRTGSDCETVLHLYEDEGVEALQRLNGMYAIVLWDTRTRTVLLARDRLGIKPLFYSVAGTQLIFASELKALVVHPDCPNEFDWAGHGDVVSTMYGGLYTHVRGVEALPGGHYLVHDSAGAHRQARYWALEGVLPEDDGTFPLTREDCVARYADLISDSVRMELQGEAGIGIFLSGGLDSSLIVALASQWGAPLHCYSLLEKSIFGTGDNHRARVVADRYGAELHSVLIDPALLLEQLPFTLETFEYLIWMIELPFFGAEFLWKHELHRYAKTHLPDLKVVLIGQGADEFAGGYSQAYAVQAGGEGDAGAWERYLGTSGKMHRQAVLQQEGVMSRWHGLVSDAYVTERAREAGARFSGLSGRAAEAPFRRVALHTLIRLQNYNLWHEDRTSASQGIEARVPFLDHRLVEFLLAIPAEYHRSLFLDKRIEREAGARWLGGGALRTPKVALATSHDMSSVDLLHYSLVTKIFPAFEEEYLSAGDSLFSRSAVRQLFEQVLLLHGRGRATETLRLVMSTAVFERMLRQRAGAARLDDLRPPSPLVSIEDFSASTFRPISSPGLAEWWKSDTPVGLAPEVKILAIAAVDGRPQGVCVVDADHGVRPLPLDPSQPWLHPLLASLSAPATPRSVAQLAASLGVPEAVLVGGLTALFRQGIIVSP